MKDLLDQFASVVVKLLRDEPIETCDALASGRMKGPPGRRWSAALSGTVPEALDIAIPDVVDEVLFAMFLAIDNGDLDLYWKPDGMDDSVSLREVGQWAMAPFYVGNDGWRDRFSAQRFFNYVVST